MKKLGITILVIIILLIIIFFTIFTSFGNGIIKPYVEDYAMAKTGMNVKFNKFYVRLNSIDITVNINNEIQANIDGKISILARSFDTVYNVNVDNLKSFNLKLDEKMNLNGKLVGNLSDFSINGKGNLFDSNIRFLARLIDYSPVNFDIDAQKLNVAKILAITKSPIYANGFLNVVADVKGDENSQNGTAHITSEKLVLNQKAFKDLNLTIPANSQVLLNSDILFKDFIADAKTNITSDILTAKAVDTKYDFKKNVITSDFAINISDLLKLEPIIKQKLNGSLNANGNLKVSDNKLDFIDGTIKGLGGEILLKQKDNTLNANINNIKIKEIFNLLQLPSALNGSIVGTATITDFSDMDKMSLVSKLNIKDGIANNQELLKLAKISLPNDFKFNSDIDVKMKNKNIDVRSKLNSNVINIKNLDATYSLEKSDGSVKANARIEDLSKIKTADGQIFKGSGDINADVNVKDNQLDNIDAKTNLFGGNFTVKGTMNNLVIDGKNLNIAQITTMAGQGNPANGNLNIDSKLNLADFKNINGQVNVSISNGLINKAYMDKMTGKKFPNNVSFQEKANIDIKKSLANFKSSINSSLVNIQKFQGSYNINNSSLNSDYIVNIKDLANLEFLTGVKLKGPLNVTGNAKLNNSNLTATANADVIGGKLDAIFKDSTLNLNIKKFIFKNLTDTLDMKHTYDGNGDLTSTYNTLTKQGKFDIAINEGKLSDSNLISLVSVIAQKDISNEVYKDGYIKGTINDNLITFNSNMKANKSQINIEKGTINTGSSKLDIPISMNIEKTDLKIHMSGTTQNPKYDVSSKYLEDKIKKEAARGIEKMFKDDNKTKDVVKGILDLF